MAIEPIVLNFDMEDVEETILPSLTYQVHNDRIIGKVDGLEAVRQAVEKILNTQLFQWEIYSETYGIESNRLIGKDFDFVLADIERTIEDALTFDDRIDGIENFRVINQLKDSLEVSFDVATIAGSFVQILGVEV